MNWIMDDFQNLWILLTMTSQYRRCVFQKTTCDTSFIKENGLCWTGMEKKKYKMAYVNSKGSAQPEVKALIRLHGSRKHTLIWIFTDCNLPGYFLFRYHTRLWHSFPPSCKVYILSLSIYLLYHHLKLHSIPSWQF